MYFMSDVPDAAVANITVWPIRSPVTYAVQAAEAVRCVMVECFMPARHLLYVLPGGGL